VEGCEGGREGDCSVVVWRDGGRWERRLWLKRYEDGKGIIGWCLSRKFN